MIDKIMLTFFVLDFLFVASGGLMIGTVFITKASIAAQPTTTNVAANMLLMQTPLTGELSSFDGQFRKGSHLPQV